MECTEKGEWSGPICVEYFMKQGSPYQPGDILYVRETWKEAPKGYYYYEDWQRNDIADVTKWKPSIRMPKEAARIWLRVTDVRVERLQDMTDDDAEAEGCFDYTSTALGFPDVWDSTIKNPTLTVTDGTQTLGFGLSNLNGARSQKKKGENR